MSDNGTCFKSNPFETFCKLNKIEHKTSPEYHPQSNGLAERNVGIVKTNLKKFLCDNVNQNISVISQIQNFLYMTHHTPNSTGICPSELIFKYQVRTQMSILQKKSIISDSVQLMSNKNPNYHQHETKAELNGNAGKPNINHKSGRRISYKKFVTGDLVYYNHNNQWIEAVILQQISPLVYEVELAHNKHSIKAHLQSLKIRCQQAITHEQPTFNLSIKPQHPMKLRQQVRKNYKY